MLNCIVPVCPASSFTRTALFCPHYWVRGSHCGIGFHRRDSHPGWWWGVEAVEAVEGVEGVEGGEEGEEDADVSFGSLSLVRLAEQIECARSLDALRPSLRSSQIKKHANTLVMTVREYAGVGLGGYGGYGG